MAKAKQRKVKIVVRGLVKEAERKLKAKLRSAACSEPWVEAQLHYVPAVDKQGQALEVCDWKRGVYPVPGMVMCRGCERFVPPIDIGSSGHCTDCRLGAMSRGQLARLPGSTSTVNMAKVKSAIRRSETPEGGI